MSRLPPPPRGKPPAPEPSSIPKGGDAPPPLPSRPGGKSAPRKLPSPPKPNGIPSAEETPDDYLEPDDWTDGGGRPHEPPALPPRNFDLSEEGGELYEEPDIAPPPAPSRPMAHHTAPAPSHVPEQEIYDELEGGAAPPDQEPDEPGETYDACSFEAQQQEEEPTEIYQEPEAVQDETYEFVPEPEKPAAPKPPPVTSTPPQRPRKTSPPPRAPAPPPDSGNRPDLPERTAQPPKHGKKLLGDGSQSAAISLFELSKGKDRLRKVSSEESKEPPTPTETNNDPEFESGSVLQKALKFQGAKPTVPVKPTVTLVSAKSLGPPPPPPVMAMPTPPDPPIIKPPAQKPPPRAQTPPLPPPPQELPSPHQYEEDELYDEGFSYMDPLQGQLWFHGDLDRAATTQKLRSIKEDGTFLVRKATRGDQDQPYTLVVLYQDREYNLKIRKRADNQVALGEKKEAEMAFADVPALIEHHKMNEVILVNRKEDKQYKTILKKSPRPGR